jgi:lipopolysaccharide biosynthesis regulator YciM
MQVVCEPVAMGGKESPLSRLRRLAGLERSEPAPYRCFGCETGHDVQYHVCPDCGSYTVEPVQS